MKRSANDMPRKSPSDEERKRHHGVDKGRQTERQSDHQKVKEFYEKNYDRLDKENPHRRDIDRRRPKA